MFPPCIHGGAELYLPALSGGARWICTWKCALRLWPSSPGFSNQVLRYWRMPEGLDRDIGLPVHRAMPSSSAIVLAK